MALTISGQKRDVFGNRRAHAGVITFDNSYTTGGKSLVPSDVGLSVIDRITFIPQSSTVSTFQTLITCDYDYTAQKVRAFEQGVRTSGTAAADTTNFVFVEDIAAANSAVKAAGPAVAIDTNYSLGGLREVLNGADLSGVSVRFEAIGR